MIKSTYQSKLQDVHPEYPFIASTNVAVESNIHVLFSRKGEGTVIYNPNKNGRYPLAYHSHEWDMTIFTKLAKDEEIVLKNI